MQYSTVLFVAFLCTTLVSARPAPENGGSAPPVGDAKKLPIIFLRPVYVDSSNNELPLTYDDRHSRASRDISVWTPTDVITSQVFKPLGSLAVGNHDDVSKALAWQGAFLARPGTIGSLVTPVDYDLIWNDEVRAFH